MIRITCIITFIIINLGIFWSQVFSRDIPQQILGDTQYIPMYEKISTLQYQLGVLIEKVTQLKDRELVPEPVPESPQVQQNIATDRSALTADNILYYTNRERQKYKLPPLKFNPKLTRSANAKITDMIQGQYFEHQSPYDSEKDFAYFITDENYLFIRVSENLALGNFTTAQEVVTAWMNSTQHRANILYPDYQEIGSAVRMGTYRGSRVYFIVQHFSIPKNACPAISESATDTMNSIESEARELKRTAQELEQEITRLESLNKNDDEIDEVIGRYNATIRTYNNLVVEYESAVTIYNEQVAEFDTCLKEIQN